MHASASLHTLLGWYMQDCDSPSERRLGGNQGEADPPATSIDVAELGTPPAGLRSPEDGSATSSPALHGASPTLSTVQFTAATASFASGAPLADSSPLSSPMSPVYASGPPLEPGSNPLATPSSPPHFQQPPPAASPQLRRSPRRLNPGLDDPPSPNVTYTRGSRRRASGKGRAAPSPLAPKPGGPPAASPADLQPSGSRAGPDITAGVPALSTLLEESEADLMSSRSRFSAAAARASSRDRTVSSMPTQAAAEPTDMSMELTLGGPISSQSHQAHQSPQSHQAVFEYPDGGGIGQWGLQHPSQHQIHGLQQGSPANAAGYSTALTDHSRQGDGAGSPMELTLSSPMAPAGYEQHAESRIARTGSSPGQDVSMDLTLGAPAAWRGAGQQHMADLQTSGTATSPSRTLHLAPSSMNACF